MKAALVIALCLGAALAMTDVQKWQHFKALHGRKFVGMGEENSRFQVFRANLRSAELLQLKDDKAMYGMTQFMDLTPEEFQAKYLGLNMTALRNWRKALPQAVETVGYGTVVDWVNGARKAVTSVKNQGNCGSCWAFSAAAAMEGCIMLKNADNVDVDVSAQQVTDCCTAGGSDGCNGGFPDLCVNWAVSQNMATWASYSYTARKGTCKAATTIAVPKNTCKFVGVSATESAMASALANGPVSICLAANALQYYYGGVISGSTCWDTQVNHAVLLVANNGNEYTVKNSWGTGWGEAGFVRMATGVNCLSMASESSQALPL